MSEYKLSHLKELESESIHIIREVAAEFENPVMLYSIGKDSSVMVRLAEKAFAPGKVPFPLMHIDSKWKFKEMIEFRDKYAQEHNWNLIVEYNKEAYEAGVGPFTHGSKVHTDLMKTQALLHALDKYKFDAAFGGARRDEEKSRAKERIFSFRDRFHQWDPKNQRPELWDIYNTRVHARRRARLSRAFPRTQRRVDTCIPALELDRIRHLAIYPSRKYSYRSPIFCQRTTHRQYRRESHHGRRRPYARSISQTSTNDESPFPYPRLLSAHRRYRIGSRYNRKNRRRNDDDNKK